MINGTRLRHINGNDLNALEQSLEKANHKVEVKAVNLKPNGDWYIHFTILDDVTFRVQNDSESRDDQEVKVSKKKQRKNK